MPTFHPNLTTGWNAPKQPFLQIAHNILVLTFHDPSEQMRAMIWDWTTSDLISDSYIDLDSLLQRVPPLTYGYEFALIDRTYCLFTSPIDSGLIRLDKLIRSPDLNLY
ncbi:hypothetical protein BJ912DRAFT_1066260 [Pholiota molesta]|nr:hypothetical protein BJ912DRAFT_1066260 [Pholiota molesta]